MWRRFTIAGDVRLDRVHDALQLLMGWTDSHLHQFSIGAAHVSPRFLTAFDVEEGDEGILETDVRLDQVLRQPGDQLTYAYDFGDGWTHTLTLEHIESLEPRRGEDAGAHPGQAAYAIACLAGERACPPEDVGGQPGYEDVAAWVRAGENPAHRLGNGLTAREMRAWLPRGWHPDHFDLEQTNAALARLAPRDISTALAQLPDELVDVINRLHRLARLELDDWLSTPHWASSDHFSPAEAEALTRPIRVVLDAVGDGLKLTPAGYLPGRVTERILREARMADNWPGTGNREDLTPPVLDLRDRVRSFGLLRKAKGHLLPTALAGRLRDHPERLLDLALSRTAADGREWERVAGGLVLVAVVGGEPLKTHPRGWDSDDAYDSVARLLGSAGFRTTDGEPPGRWDAFGGARLLGGAVTMLVSCVGAGPEPEAAVPSRDAADLTRRVALAILRRMR